MAAANMAPMTSPLRCLLLLALAAAGLIAGASSASAAKAPAVTKKFTYKVELKGTQTTTWTLNHVGAGAEACDTNQTGQGKETIRFSSKPAVATSYEGLSQPFFFVKKGSQAGMLSMPLRGTISRQGAITTQPLPAENNCADGVGGAPPTPDCGTKRIQGLVVKPEYEYNKDRIVLTQSDAAKGYEFKHCPSGGSPWPYLLQHDTADNTITQQLPYDDLFNQGKNIIIATGIEKQTTGESQWTTKLRWELSITRIKVEDLTKQ
jgi:hypothetical protein